MGNWFSKRKVSEVEEIAVQEISAPPNLSEEIKSYIKKKINQESVLSNKEIEDVRAQLDDTVKKYETLKKDYETLFQNSTEVRKIPSKISEKAIDDYVKAVFTAPSVVQQRGIITDAIEGAVYKKVLKAILCSVAHAVDSAQVQFIGHKLTFCIEPLVSNELKRGLSQNPEQNQEISGVNPDFLDVIEETEQNVEMGYIEHVNELLEKLYSESEKSKNLLENADKLIRSASSPKDDGDELIKTISDCPCTNCHR